MNGHAVKAPRIHYAKKELNIIFEENILLPIIENNNLADALANLFFYYFIFDLQYPKNFVQCLGFFHDFIFKHERIQHPKRNDTFIKIRDCITIQFHVISSKNFFHYFSRLLIKIKVILKY